MNLILFFRQDFNNLNMADQVQEIEYIRRKNEILFLGIFKIKIL